MRYLSGIIWAKLTVHTDKHALKYFMSAPTRTTRQERWLGEIMRFTPDIKYVNGTDNVVADALHRRVNLDSLGFYPFLLCPLT